MTHFVNPKEVKDLVAVNEYWPVIPAECGNREQPRSPRESGYPLFAGTTKQAGFSKDEVAHHDPWARNFGQAPLPIR